MRRKTAKVRKEKISTRSVERANRLEHLAGTLAVPQDILAESILISVYGRQCVRLENYKGILDYSDTQIKVWSRDGKIIITGKKIHISYCSDVELCIIGRISQIQYIE